MQDIALLRKLAAEFRGAIEISPADLRITFENFPRGSCGDVVLLLGTNLIEKEFSNSDTFWEKRDQESNGFRAHGLSKTAF